MPPRMASAMLRCGSKRPLDRIFALTCLALLAIPGASSTAQDWGGTWVQNKNHCSDAAQREMHFRLRDSSVTTREIDCTITQRIDIAGVRGWHLRLACRNDRESYNQSAIVLRHDSGHLYYFSGTTDLVQLRIKCPEDHPESLGSSGANSQPAWSPKKPIATTKWTYSEARLSNTLVQCQVSLKSDLSLGYDITIALLSKGSIMIGIVDQNWAYRIKADHGWREGWVFDSVILFLKNGRITTTATIAPDLQFVISIPKDSPAAADMFMESERFAVSVGGLTMKGWEMPGLPIAWNRLRKCALAHLR